MLQIHVSNFEIKDVLWDYVEGLMEVQVYDITWSCLVDLVQY